MMQDWNNRIIEFIKACNQQKVKMILVGGGAVNFHGYQRHSADVDFWIETSNDNFKALLNVFQSLGYDINEFPKSVLSQNQNISVKFTPEDLDLELITRFALRKSFKEAFDNAVENVHPEKNISWKVLAFDDLLENKKRAGRPKDILDIMELKRLNSK